MSAPSVAPIAPDVLPELSHEEIRRYSRHLILDDFGMRGQRKLKATKVLCIGSGGLGSPVLMYLAAAGVGTLGLVDDDVVDESNLQRQIIHTTSTLGKSKVDSAAARVTDINPNVVVHKHTFRLTSTNALDVIAQYDLVVDGSDNFPTRYLVNDACVILGKPLVYGAIQKFEGQVSVFNYRGGPNYRDLFPEAPPPGEVPSCAEGGVLGILPGVIGCMQATEAIKVALGREEGTLSGRLLIYDAMRMRFHEVSHISTSLPRDRDILVHCKGGARSAAACQTLAQLGFEKDRLFSMDGGILAWAKRIDKSMPIY
ncbi:adenylyltransferase sulfurtransferase [Chrysochromulina tobinii]|uniref:Adenylyltransferase sulfurtransferase n=1 Tax=Chrysochromulina tobinii TaxID=1460289 RepID=A0A0M0JTP2_9EUKA|nr:adenylyltransferase sulfurtransferase [Chrysochromulina tobinii]|eukprot:KOO29934.1 adenylyltransferase sulfurtransferase [Chrysochromulina sp. CCMP291]